MSDPDAEANALAIAALVEAEVDEDIAAAAAAAAAGFSDDDDEVEQSGEDVYIPDLLWDEYTARGYWLTDLQQQFEQETEGLGKLAGSEHPFDLVVSALRTHISNIMNVENSDEKGLSRRTQFLLNGDHLAAMVSVFEGTAEDINASGAEFLGDRSEMYTFCSDVDSMTKHRPPYLYPARAQEIKERVLALARFSEAELTRPNGYEPRTADDMTGESIKSLEASLKHLLTGPEKGFMWKEQFE